MIEARNLYIRGQLTRCISWKAAAFKARGGALEAPPGSESGACIQIGGPGNLGDPTFSSTKNRNVENRVKEPPGSAIGSHPPLPRANRTEWLRGIGKRGTTEACRDGLLEVLAERSTEGRLSGHSPERSVRWGSEAQATHCREGEAGHNALTYETGERP